MCSPQGLRRRGNTVKEPSNREQRLKSTQGDSESAAARLWSRVPCLWKMLDLCADAFTVVFAGLDIIMDVWIAYTYYQDGRSTFFHISLVLLFIAQLSYAALFISQYGSNWSNLKAACAFVCVLPVAQLVPVWVYVESLRLPYVDRVMERLGLRRTHAPVRQAGEDLVLFQIRCKLEAHIGFLVEACVEAVPQSVLQLVAMQHAGESNLFSVLSIVLSISCLASKGYVAAFSIHRPMFVFNMLCFALDVVGMFATAAWLSSPSDLAPYTTLACQWWYKLATVTAGFIIAFYTFLLFRIKAHDQYEVYRLIFNDPRKAYHDHGVRRELKDIVMATPIILLCVFPATVVLLSVKLSLIPVLVFGTLDPHKNISRKLFDWIMQGDTDLRFWCTTNALLQCCGTYLTDFENSKKLDEPGRVGEDTREARKARRTNQVYRSNYSKLIHDLIARTNSEVGNLLAEGELNTMGLREIARSENRSNMMLHHRQMIEGAVAHAWGEFIKFCKNGSNDGGHGLKKKLVTFGDTCAGTSFVCGLLCWVGFILFSAVLPCISLAEHVLLGSWEHHLLEVVLSSIYTVLATTLLLLAPGVIYFHRISLLANTVMEYIVGYERHVQTNYFSYDRWYRRHYDRLPGATDSNLEDFRDGKPSQLMDLSTVKRSYSGWIVGCQVQAGLVGKFGPWIPQLIHAHEKAPLRPSLVKNGGWISHMEW